MSAGIDKANGDRFRKTIPFVHAGGTALPPKHLVKFIDERLRSTIAAHIHVLDRREIRLRKGLFSEKFQIHRRNARKDVRLLLHDLPGTHLRVELDAHDIDAAHEHAHMHIDAQPEAMEDGQDVVERPIIPDRFAEKLFRLAAKHIEDEIVVRDDLRFARSAAAGKVHRRLLIAEFLGGRMRVFAIFQVFFKGNIAECRGAICQLIISLCRQAHEIRTVAHEGGKPEIKPSALIQIVDEQKAAARRFCAFAQFFGRQKWMYEVDRRAQFVRRIECDQRGGRVGHAEGDCIPLFYAELGGQIVRKRVDPAQNAIERILAPVIRDGRFHRTCGYIFKDRLVHRGIGWQRSDHRTPLCENIRRASRAGLETGCALRCAS